MAETTDRMIEEADRAREKLAEDLNCLESRMESLVDWHVWFRLYPAVFLGAAFLGGLLLGFAIMPALRRRRIV